MSDRHAQLPAHPDLEYYRKQARALLRRYEAGDPAARDRVAAVAGDRAGARFGLSDAQFVLAREHGFRSWAGFRAGIESRRAAGARPAARVRLFESADYASWADDLLTQLRRGDPAAAARLRAAVPGYPADAGAAAAELTDARLVVARELGLETWPELAAQAEQSRRETAGRKEGWRRLRPEAEALLAGDTARLAGLTAEQAGTLLQMLAMRELLGTALGAGLGVPRAALDLLIGKAASLDVPLHMAVRGDRVAYVRLLLAAGADLSSRQDGVTALEDAIVMGTTAMVDLLAGHGIFPPALWTYAACGRLDLVRACFHAGGTLRPAAALARPRPACFFPVPPRNPAASGPDAVLAEAFACACQHGRAEVARWFLGRGLSPDVAGFLGQTGLHLAILHQQPEMVRLLLERGADRSVRDELFRQDARGLATMLSAAAPGNSAARQIRDLITP